MLRTGEKPPGTCSAQRRSARALTGPNSCCVTDTVAACQMSELLSDADGKSCRPCPLPPLMPSSASRRVTHAGRIASSLQHDKAPVLLLSVAQDIITHCTLHMMRTFILLVAHGDEAANCWSRAFILLSSLDAGEGVRTTHP